MARILKDYPSISLKPESINGKLDFASVFGRNRAVHVEIGTGKATFLLNQAEAYPDTNFLGIEKAAKYYRYAVDRIGRWSLANVRLIRTDAADFIANYLPDDSVDCFHIYFPDPWPKKRHHKRRFICNANLEQIIRCLKSGGTIRIATDHADYFEQIKEVLSAKAEHLKKIDFRQTAGANEGEWVGTNFERKYLIAGKHIYTIAMQKIT